MEADSASDGAILDAHATCMDQIFADQRVDIPPAIRPFGSSVYNIKQLYQEQPPVYQSLGEPLRTFQNLYDSGFTQVADSKCAYHARTTCSPLILRQHLTEGLIQVLDLSRDFFRLWNGF